MDPFAETAWQERVVAIGGYGKFQNQISITPRDDRVENE